MTDRTLGEDWIKVRSWGLRAQSLDDLVAFLTGSPDSSKAKQRTALAEFVQLPAAQAMPAQIRSELDERFGLLVPDRGRSPRSLDDAIRTDGNTHAVTAAFNPDQERDSDGKFAPEGGSADSGSADSGSKDAGGQSIVGSAQYEYAVNEWLGGSSYAEDMASSGHGYPEGGPVADKVSEDSRSLLEQAVRDEGTKSPTDLYRGIGLDAAEVDNLISGKTIDLPASSFSPLVDNADAYGEAAAQALVDMVDHASSSEQVRFEVPAGTRSIDISSQGEKAWGEPEHIVAGRFHIVGVERSTGGQDSGIPTVIRLAPGGGG